MDATQMIDDYVLESDEDEEEEERENQRGEPLAKLRVLKNQHIPETELPLYSGENVLGRDPNTCNVPLLARSVSKQHTTVSLTVYRGKSRRSEGAKEVLVWDMGSMNGTRKGHRKLTPHVRYALSEGDSLMVADIPCQYVSLPVDETQSPAERNPVDIGNSSRAHSSSDIETEARPFGTNREQDSGAGTSNGIEKSVENGNNKKVLNRLLLFSSEEESGDTPARTKALCSDRSRTQLQETLVPESDSDGEQERRPSWRGQSVVSESDSMASPRSNFIPESPITPSSIQNRPKKHVSFSEESDVDAGRQQLRKKSSQVIVDDSEEEEEGRNVSLLGGREPERSGQVVPGEKSSDFSPPEEDESPVSTLASHAVAKPAFNMDSDTEEEEEGDMKLLECRASLPDSHLPAADSPSKLSQFHMDSDTDVDEENESRVVVDAGAASVHASDDVAKPTRRIPVVQPTGLTAEDSDTDDEILSETDTKTSPAPHHKSTTITTSAPSAQPVDSHLDSDTDVEEEEEVQGVDSRPKNASSKLEATPTVLSNSGGVEAMSAVPPSNLCSESDSDTDDESIVPVAAGQLTRAVVDTGVELEILSDSDTDLEEDAPLQPPVFAKGASTTPSALTKVTTDSSSTAGDQADEGQFSGAIPQMQRFSTPKGGAVEEMETQAFFNSPPDPFKRPLPSSTRPILPSSSDSQEDDDPCVVDETQSFILETPDRRGDPALDETQSFALEALSEDIDQEQATTAAGDSFQRGLKRLIVPVAAGQLTRAVVDTGVELEILSDSDTDLEEDAPLQPPVFAKGASTTPSALTKVTTDSSSTAGDQADEGQFSGAIPQMQRFSTPKGGAVEEMETQAFFNSPPDPFKRPLPSSTRPILPSSSDSQEDDDPCVVDETQSFILETPDRRGDPALDETQSFALEALSEDIDQEQATTAAGNSFQRGLTKTPQAQCLAMESTQNFVSMVGDVYLEATQAYLPVPPADGTSTEYDLAMEATQVYSDEEKEPTRQIDEQATQAYIQVPESDSDAEDDEGDSEARAADLATAETQPLVSSSTSAIATAETQLMSAREEEEDVAEVKPSPQTRPATATSDAEERNNPNSFPALRKRTAKSQRLVESQESPLAAVSLLSTAETQPMAPTSETEESDEEELLPVTRKRTGEAKRLVESQASALATVSLLYTAETQPMAPTSETEESDEEETLPIPRKITAEAKRLVESQDKSPFATVSLLYTAETQPMAPTSETEESDEEELLPVTRKRTGKAKRLVESQESPLATVSLLYTAETQPMAPTSETEESDEEELLPVTHKRRAQRLIESQESQPIATCEIEEGGNEDVPKAGAQTARCPRARGRGRGFEAGPSSVGRRGRSTRGVATEEQEEPSGPPRRQTRGRGQTTRSGRGRGRVAVPKDDVEGADGESEEEAKVELVTRGRGRKSSKQQKDKRAEEEELEQEHTEMQGTLQKEQDARERIEMEKRKREEEKTRQETEKREQVERERLDRERRQEEERLVREMAEREEREKRERVEREEKERIERERKEREEKERKEKIQKEREEKERIQRERKEREEKERKEKIQKEREEQERELRERKDREEREKLERENSEREERERTERERKKREEKERLQQEKEQLERERREEEERLVREMAEREERENRERVEREEKERLEREEKEKLEKERKEREEQEKLVTRESFAMNDRADESRNNDAPTPGASSRGRGRGRGRGRRTVPKPEAEGSQNDQASAPETSARGRKIQKVEAASNNAPPAIENADSQQPGITRGRRASRSTATAMSAEVLEAEPNNSTSVDGPFRRTRSRSNSSNSVSSETSFSSINSHGPSRGTTKTSRTPAGNRSSGRRATVTGESSKSDRADESRSNDDPTPGASSLGRGRGRGRRTVSKLETAAVGGSQNEQASAPKTPARGRKIQKVEAASNNAPPAIEEKADSQQPGTTRGRRRAKASDTELTAAAEEAPTTQVEQSATEDLPEPNGNVEGSGQEQKTKPVEAAVNVNEEAEAKETGRGKGRKRELEEELTGESSKTSQGNGKVQRGRRAEAAAAEEDMEAKEDEPAPANRGGRGQRKKSEPPEVPPVDGESKVESEKMEEETPRKRGRGRPSAAQKKKEEGQEDGETSAHSSTVQDANVSSSETPNVSRKRGPPVGSSPVIKTPRLSGRTDKQACKVLFTCVSDETGEKALSRLGGSLARDVWDMTYLVTDKVRRTVKFLCAIARGIPIVDTQWLQKCGKAGSFLPPNGFIVKDTEQEKKFNFCLQESLRTANNQPLLQGYEIHVTKSVLPEPVHMKDIICCSGATYLPKMPSKHKAHAVVISCAEDWALCRPAVSASIPIVTAEFILTGILQQKVDVETHTLSISAANPSPQAAAGRGRGKKKT